MLMRAALNFGWLARIRFTYAGVAERSNAIDSRRIGISIDLVSSEVRILSPAFYIYMLEINRFPKPEKHWFFFVFIISKVDFVFLSSYPIHYIAYSSFNHISNYYTAK